MGYSVCAMKACLPVFLGKTPQTHTFLCNACTRNDKRLVINEIRAFNIA